MAVVTLTSREKETLATRYDQNKLTFERVLARDLRAFFAGLGADLFATMSTNGLPPDFDSYLDELAAILKKNYRITGAFFSSHIQRLLKETEPKSPEHEETIEAVQDERSDIEALILLALLAFYQRQSIQHAKFILDTTRKVVRSELTKILTQASIDGVTLTQDEIARKLTKAVNKRNNNRVQGIAEDEVGDIAQAAKQEEANQVVRAASIAGVAVVDPRKTWIDFGDNKVRPAHKIANNQERHLDALYNVGGELLMYPKDMSHGASIGNTARCRCDSVIEI